MAFTYVVDFKATNTQYLLWTSAVLNFIHIGQIRTKYGQYFTYTPRDPWQCCIFVLNFLQAVVTKWHTHACTHTHIFVRQDQPLLGAEETNGKKLGEVHNFCAGTTYFCRM